MNKIKWPCDNCGNTGYVVEFIDDKYKMVHCPKCNREKVDSFGLLLKQNNRINQLQEEKTKLTEENEQLSAQVVKMQRVVDAAQELYEKHCKNCKACFYVIGDACDDCSYGIIKKAFSEQEASL